MKRVWNESNWDEYLEYLDTQKTIADATVEELSADAQADDRDELKAKLKDAGIPFGGNTSTEKLRELAKQL